MYGSLPVTESVGIALKSNIRIKAVQVIYKPQFLLLELSDRRVVLGRKIIEGAKNNARITFSFLLCRKF